MTREMCHAENIAQHGRLGDGSVMVFGGFSRDQQTELFVLNRGTMTGQRYFDEILDAYIKLYAGAVGERTLCTLTGQFAPLT